VTIFPETGRPFAFNNVTVTVPEEPVGAEVDHAETFDRVGDIGDVDASVTARRIARQRSGTGRHRTQSQHQPARRDRGQKSARHGRYGLPEPAAVLLAFPVAPRHTITVPPTFPIGKVELRMRRGRERGSRLGPKVERT
jgi:hypothetical protein